MTYTPSSDQINQEQEAPGPNPIESHPFFGIVSGLVETLSDGVDHPEIWPMLAQAAQHDDIAGLSELVDLLRPTQFGAVEKALNVVSAIVHALSVDRSEGLAHLYRLAARHAHCPLIAGAIFFVERQNRPGEGPDLSQRFCEAPFVKFETLMDGKVAPCCSIWTQQRLGDLDGQSFAEIWNSPAAQAMRESILDGSYRYCNKQRCSLITDDALPRRDDISDAGLRHIIDHQVTELATPPRWLFLAHDISCNLSCPSCRSEILGASEAQEARFAKIEEQVFQPLLNAEGRVRVSLSGQGDPWSSPHYRSILRYLADHELDVDLNLHTNALLMGEKRWAEYAGLDRYKALVDISIDSCTPWVYETVRRPGKWKKLEPNLRFIAAKRAAGDFRELHLNATIQLDNFHEMPALVDFATDLGADSMRMYMMQNTGGHIETNFDHMNVGNPNHPLHPAFLQTLRDPRLGSPLAHLYDVAAWRTRALGAKLPTDSLDPDFSREALTDAVRSSADDHAVVVALCVAGRSRFRDDLELLRIEARALAALGFERQAQYRLREREALGGESICIG